MGLWISVGKVNLTSASKADFLLGPIAALKRCAAQKPTSNKLQIPPAGRDDKGSLEFRGLPYLPYRAGGIADDEFGHHALVHGGRVAVVLRDRNCL